MLWVRRSVQLKHHYGPTQCFLFAKERKEIQNSRWFTIGSIAENILFVGKIK
jgi:hypothetical protein